MGAMLYQLPLGPPLIRRSLSRKYRGIEGQGWFLGFPVFTHEVKVSFFRGTSQRPVPPGGTPKSQDARWIDIHDGARVTPGVVRRIWSLVTSA